MNILQKVEGAILSASVLGIAALTILNVLSRSLLGESLAVAEEVSQFLIITVTFVGLSYAASLGRHIRMTALTDQMSADKKRKLELFVLTMTAMLMFVLCAYSCRYVYSVYQLGGIYPVTRVPFFVVYLVAPIGFALAGIQYLLRVFRHGSRRSSATSTQSNRATESRAE